MIRSHKYDSKCETGSCVKYWTYFTLSNIYEKHNSFSYLTLSNLSVVCVDLIGTFNVTSRYLDDIFTFDDHEELHAFAIHLWDSKDAQKSL